MNFGYILLVQLNIDLNRNGDGRLDVILGNSWLGIVSIKILIKIGINIGNIIKIKSFIY